MITLQSITLKLHERGLIQPDLIDIGNLARYLIFDNIYMY